MKADFFEVDGLVINDVVSLYSGETPPDSNINLQGYYLQKNGIIWVNSLIDEEWIPYYKVFVFANDELVLADDEIVTI